MVLITLIELSMELIIILVMIISDILRVSLIRVKAEPIVFMRAAGVRLTLAVTINLEACTRAEASVLMTNERP